MQNSQGGAGPSRVIDMGFKDLVDQTKAMYALGKEKGATAGKKARDKIDAKKEAPTTPEK